MPAPAGTNTAFRLARIAAMVLGSLLFLYACENSKSALLADKWVEVAIAGALLAAGLGAAWFEIKLTDYDDYDEEEDVADRAGHPARAGIREFLVESEGWSMRAKIARSGDLVFHGQDRGGTYPAYEWMWIFDPDTFPAIRTALGDADGDLLDLLEEVVPQLDRHGRHDPGAWLRAHDIPATYREKGVSATQETRELPLLRPGLPRRPPRRDEPTPKRAHRDELPPSRSRRAGRNPTPPLDEDSAAVPARREHSIPARSRREPVAPARFRQEDAEPAWPARVNRAAAHSKWDDDPTPPQPLYEESEPRWIARDEELGSPPARPEPRPSRYTRPAWDQPRQDDFAPAPSYRRETEQPQHDSRRSGPPRSRPDEFMPYRREQPWPVQDQTPPVRREQPAWQRDEYPAPWPEQPVAYEDPPPARRHRSAPPPNSAGTGRHAASHSAPPPWP
ncbi:hypothetical protein [Nocardia iowensis]|uniref:Uncharacterized protein n=1 Tax=Nocardia iowensis TaxID=204891 RepID=A0ABX8RJB7_NOCIO|nr:hypothetical protein [Nocardia iowensis]QXN89722.1 hypothetical protein KV110_30255 [Nocardia iowensis]